MIQRPKINETDEDLVKLDEEFHSSEEAKTSVKLNYSGKRKSNESKGEDGKEGKSLFAQKHKEKKKKESIRDHTQLKEVSQQFDNVDVLSSVKERNVPLLSPESFLPQFPASTQSFPIAPKLKQLNTKDACDKSQCKSLYMQYMKTIAPNNDVPVPHELTPCCNDKIQELGNRSFILSTNDDNASKIHDESISKLLTLSHNERLEERNEILASFLDPTLIDFVKSFRSQEEMECDAVPNNQPTPEEELTIQSPQETETEEDDMLSTLNLLPSENTYPKAETETKDLLSTLTLLPSEHTDWVHMDKVEMDKLKWMRQVSKPKPLKQGESFIARFNFEGDLLPYSADISWREGLHHHGEEPGRAGYTLDELFILVRSTVDKQRQLGLKAIGSIVRNAKEGLYDASFDCSVIQLMVDAGLVLLLRFAIDVKPILELQEALRALYYLVCNEPDDRCLEVVETCFHYDLFPGISSQTHSKHKSREELDAEENELKDVEVVQLDIIRALVRMDVLVRLRVLLESVELPPPAVLHILGILCRISQHSLNAAVSVASCPGLLKTIFDNFLPINYTSLLQPTQVTNVYGVPLRQAVRLFKILCGRSRNIASSLIADYDLMGRIEGYVSMEPSEGKLPEGEALLLVKESYSLWAVLLAYALKKAQHAYNGFFPLIVKQLLFYRDKVDLNVGMKANAFNYDVGAHLMQVLTKALNVAAHRTLLLGRKNRGEASVTTQKGEKRVLPVPEIDWEGFAPIFELTQVCVAKWVSQFVKGEPSLAAQKLLATTLDFVSFYLSKWRDQATFDGEKFEKTMNEIHKSMEPLLESKFLDRFLDKLSPHSCFTTPLRMTKRDPLNLGSLGCICHGGAVVPILRPETPFPLLNSLASLSKVICSSGFRDFSIRNLLNNVRFKDYLRVICSSKHPLEDHWMVRLEYGCVVRFLQTAAIVGCDDNVLFHSAALALLPQVQKGDEHLVKAVLQEVVCNPSLIADLSDPESRMQFLSLAEYKPLQSPSLKRGSSPSPIELTEALVEAIPAIGQDLVVNLMASNSLEESTARAAGISFLINSLTIDKEDDSRLLDSFWPLAPLKMLRLVPSNDRDENPDRVESVVKWLQASLLLVQWRSASLATDATGWFRHLSLAFLVSSDLFLDARVNTHLQACLRAVLRHRHLTLSCTSVYSRLNRCFDWYKEMTEQFGAVSYGDATFALFIVVPLQRHWPLAYRELLFGDSSSVLPFIRLSVEDVEQFVPMEAFISAAEETPDQIIKYRSAIGSSAVRESVNSFLYFFASSHIKLFTQTN